LGSGLASGYSTARSKAYYDGPQPESVLHELIKESV